MNGRSRGREEGGGRVEGERISSARYLEAKNDLAY